MNNLNEKYVVALGILDTRNRKKNSAVHARNKNQVIARKTRKKCTPRPVKISVAAFSFIDMSPYFCEPLAETTIPGSLY